MSTHIRAVRADAKRRLVPGIALMTALLTTGASAGQSAMTAHPPAQRRDQRVELAMKITQPFTVVAVGDMLQMVPFSKNNDPAIQFLVNLMQKADMTFANDEAMPMDMDAYAGRYAHLQAPKEVADDWAHMGIKMMTKANNHTWDTGEAGLWANLHELDRVGIIHVGVGRNMLEARLARYAATPKGTVGFVGVYPESTQINGRPSGRVVTVTPAQLAQLAAMRDSILARRTEVENPIDPPADPAGTVNVFGVRFQTPGTAPESSGRRAARPEEPRTAQRNTLRLTTYNGVTAAQMAQLRAIAGDTGQGDTLSAFGVMFKVMPGPGDYSYEMNRQDERDILREVRTGKQFSDFEGATIHWHQNRYAFQHYSFDHYPADYQIAFAHDVIDQGADLFFGHGVHTIKGIEIYKGKPIFYGLSNFVVQEEIFASWRDASRGGTEPPTPLTGPIIGQGELNEVWWEWMQQPANFEALLASCHYEHGVLTEVRIYPVDLGGPGRPGSQLGIPKRPSPDVAARILGHVIEYSKPFGTKIAIEDGVGVIRLAPSQRTQ